MGMGEADDDTIPPAEFKETTCLPPRMAAWALANRAESGITDIRGFIVMPVKEEDEDEEEVEEEGGSLSPARSVFRYSSGSVPGGNVIVFVPSGFVTRFVTGIVVVLPEEEENVGGSMISMSDSPPPKEVMDAVECVEVVDADAPTTAPMAEASTASLLPPTVASLASAL